MKLLFTRKSYFLQKFCATKSWRYTVKSILSQSNIFSVSLKLHGLTKLLFINIKLQGFSNVVTGGMEDGFDVGVGGWWDAKQL